MVLAALAVSPADMPAGVSQREIGPTVVRLIRNGTTHYSMLCASPRRASLDRPSLFSRWARCLRPSASPRCSSGATLASEMGKRSSPLSGMPKATRAARRARSASCVRGRAVGCGAAATRLSTPCSGGARTLPTPCPCSRCYLTANGRAPLTLRCHACCRAGVPAGSSLTPHGCALLARRRWSPKAVSAFTSMLGEKSVQIELKNAQSPGRPMRQEYVPPFPL